MPENESGTIGLTGEEAYALLGLALTSPQKLDAVSEKALRKLAAFCKTVENNSNHLTTIQCELEEAG